MLKIDVHKARSSLNAFFNERKYQSANIAAFITNFPDAEIYADDPESISVLAAVDSFCPERRLYVDMLDPCLCGKLAPLLTGYKETVFGGVDLSVAEAIAEMFSSGLLWRNPCRLYYYPQDKSISPPSPLFGELRNIAERDAALVDKHYTYRSEQSIDDILECIRNRPSSALYVDNSPVSWVLTHRDGTMGVMFTLPQFRRGGTGLLVALDLTKKQLEKNRLPFLHIVHGNDASYGLAEKSGFIFSHDVVWFCASLFH